LKFNTDKTEFLWLGIRQQLLKVTQQLRDVNGVRVAPVSKVEVVTDEELTTTAPVNHVVSDCFYQLQSFWRALVIAFILCQLDYCNATLYGVATNQPCSCVLDRLEAVYQVRQI